MDGTTDNRPKDGREQHGRIGVPFDRFRELVETATDGLKTVECEHGHLRPEDTAKAVESDTYWNMGLSETVAAAMDVDVVDIHLDHGSNQSVWVVYDPKDADIGPTAEFNLENAPEPYTNIVGTYARPLMFALAIVAVVALLATMR